MALSDWTDKLKSVFHREAAAEKLASGLSPDERGNLMHESFLTSLNRFRKTAWQVAKPYWTSDEKWDAYKHLGGIIALTAVEIFISLQVNEWNNDITNAYTGRDYPEFWKQIGVYAGLSAAFVGVHTNREYLTKGLSIKWRDWMTKNAIDEENPDSFMGNENYYHLHKVAEKSSANENINQKIGEDFDICTKKSLWLGLGLLRAAADIALFSGTLLNISGGGWMVACAIAYATIGSKVMHKLSSPLDEYTNKQQGLEAKFREGIYDVSKNADQIALLGGAPTEAEGLKEKFKKVIGNSWELAKRHKDLMYGTTAYNQGSPLIPMIVTSPFYFMSGGIMSLGQVMQAREAFAKILSALNWFVDGQAFIKETQASVNRVNNLNETLASARNMNSVHPQQNAPAA